MGAEAELAGALVERVPPHSLEAEQAVLGSLLLDNTAMDRVADVVSAADFYRPEHRGIFECVAGLIRECKPADPLTVLEAGGYPMRYLNELCQSVASAYNARAYAEIVRERALERGLLAVGVSVQASAFDAKAGVVERIDAGMAALTHLAAGMAARESVSLDQALISFIDRLQDEAAGNTRVIQTGLHHLDKQLNGGLREGELMVIGARPKMGKTALALTMVRHMAHRYGALVLSQEMPVSQLIARNVASMGEINLAHLRSPADMPQDGWTRVTEAIERMKAMTMMLDDQRALTLADVRRKLMEAKRRQRVDVVVVDFLQLMAGGEGGDNRNQELDRISNGLKAMAGEFGVAVILLSQLSREADKRHGPPVMTDLRDSGAIEAAADVIALLYREFAHPLGQHTEDWRAHAQLDIVQRNGAPGSINLRWNGEFQQFSDWDGHTPFRKAAARGGSYKGGLD